MSDASEEIKRRIQNMSWDEYQEKVPKQSKPTRKGKAVLDILFWRVKVIKALFGIDGTIGATSGGNSGGNQSTPSPNNGGYGNNSKGFDPEDAFVRRMQEEAYFRLIDGRGDPHHCDCDHDER